MTDVVATLRDPATIRLRAESLLEKGLAGELAHFDVRLDALEEVVDRVLAVTRAAYPDLVIPTHSRWGHFRVGGVDRVALFDEAIAPRDDLERTRCRFDLVTTSVLLDAGAGPDWTYRESETAETWSRSEGLAVASYRMFSHGVFSASGEDRLRADASRLEEIDAEILASSLQVSAANPLAGLDGRAALLRELGAALRARSLGRVGGLVDVLETVSEGGRIRAGQILRAVLEGIGSIWHGSMSVDGESVGDVWRYPPGDVSAADSAGGLVPFHKIAQWLVYSLIEPLEFGGFEVVGVDELTALAEYRNGGLLVDGGVLVPKQAEVTERRHSPGSAVVIEWRALTVALIDRVAEKLRAVLGRTPQELPLASVLEGGTWRAGRQIAREKRPDGGPPIRVDTNGTVF